MQIKLELPEDIAQELKSKWKDLPRAIALTRSAPRSFGGYLDLKHECRWMLF
ncbi:MAG TPA: hypothetical protein VK686_15285 [Bryobacteraceae bacterium]|nr:hypothetical protein [Bryobacteraceae bacterium]